MNKSGTVKLNTPEFKRAIQLIIDREYNIKLPIKDIKISDREGLLKVKGEDIFRYDTHRHYTNPKDHLFAISDWLTSFQEIIHNTDLEKILKAK
jgi:hypothetical protein